MKKIVFSLLLLFSTSELIAKDCSVLEGCEITATKGYDWTRVVGDVRIASCDPVSYAQRMLNNDISPKMVYSILLSAYEADQKLRIKMDTANDGQCDIKFAIADDISNP